MVDWIADKNGKRLVKPKFHCHRCGRAVSDGSLEVLSGRCSCGESYSAPVREMAPPSSSPQLSRSPSPSSSFRYSSEDLAHERAWRAQEARAKRARQSVGERRLELAGKLAAGLIGLSVLIAVIAAILVFGYHESFRISLWAALLLAGLGAVLVGVVWLFCLIAELCSTNRRVAGACQICGGLFLMAVGIGLAVLSYYHDSSGWYAHYLNGVYRGTFYHSDASNDFVAGVAVVLYLLISIALIADGFAKLIRKTARA